MYFRRLDPILRQFSPIAPRPRLTPHCGGAPNAGVDGEDPAVAREARTRTVEAGNDASTNVSQSKRKRKAKRRLTVGKDVNKSKRLKMQQQHLEEEYIQQILAGSDHDVYEDDEEIFDSIHVANGKLMKLSPQAQDPAADGPIELAPLSAGLAPIGAGTVPVNKSGSQPTTPVADAKSAATKLAKSEGQKKTQGNKQPNQLRQSLLTQSIKGTPSRNKVAVTEDSPLSDLSEAKTRQREWTSSSKKLSKRGQPGPGAAKKRDQPQTLVQTRLGGTGLGNSLKATRSPLPPQQQPSNDNATNQKNVSTSTTKSTTAVARKPNTLASISLVREIPGTPEDAVTPPNSSDEESFGVASTRKENSSKEKPQLGIRTPPTRSVAVTPKSAGTVSTEAEMPRKTRSSAKKKAAKAAPPPAVAAKPPSQPKLNGPPPTPATDDSPVAVLRFDIRKFPSDPKTISIHGSDIYSPEIRFVSYDLLLTLVRKEWPVDCGKQLLLMNWTFRLMNQEAFNHCIVQLCKHGRKMHEIVLCDLEDGKLPEGVLKIQAGLKKIDKLFWQGKPNAGTVPWSFKDLPKDRRHSEVRKAVSGEAPAEKRRQTIAGGPTGSVNIWSSPFSPVVANATSHPRPTETSESDHPAKRRVIESESTPITPPGASPKNRWSSAGAAGRVAGRFTNPTASPLPSPSRWTKGEDNRRAPEVEDRKDPVTPDVEVGPKPVVDVASPKEPENVTVEKEGVPLKKEVIAVEKEAITVEREGSPEEILKEPEGIAVEKENIAVQKEGITVEKEGGSKEIPKETIRLLDTKAPDTPSAESSSAPVSKRWQHRGPPRKVPLEGYDISPVSGFSIVRAQPQASGPIVLQPELMTGVIAGQNAFRAIRTPTQPAEKDRLTPLRSIGAAPPQTPSPCAPSEPMCGKFQSPAPSQAVAESSLPVVSAIPTSSTSILGAPPTPKPSPPEPAAATSTTEANGISVPEPMDLDEQPGALESVSISKTPFQAPAERKSIPGPGEEIDENSLSKEVPGFSETPVTSGFVAVNAGAASRSTQPQRPEQNGTVENDKARAGEDPTIGNDMVFLSTANEAPPAEPNAPVYPMVQKPAAKQPAKKRARQSATKSKRSSTSNSTPAPESDSPMPVSQMASPAVGQATTSEPPPRMIPDSALPPSSQRVASSAVSSPMPLPMPLPYANPAGGASPMPAAKPAEGPSPMPSTNPAEVQPQRVASSAVSSPMPLPMPLPYANPAGGASPMPAAKPAEGPSPMPSTNPAEVQPQRVASSAVPSPMPMPLPYVNPTEGPSPTLPTTPAEGQPQRFASSIVASSPMPSANPPKAQQQQTAVTAPVLRQRKSTTATPQPPATDILQQPLKRTFDQAISTSTSRATTVSASPVSIQPVLKSGTARKTRKTVPRAPVIPAAKIPRPQPYRRPVPIANLSDQVVATTAPVPNNPVFGQDAVPGSKSLKGASASTPDSRKKGDDQQRRPAARLDSLNQRPGMPWLNQPNAAAGSGIGASNNGGRGSVSNGSNYGIRPLFTEGPSPRQVPLPPAYVTQPRAEEPRPQHVLNPLAGPLGSPRIPPPPKSNDFRHVVARNGSSTVGAKNGSSTAKARNGTSSGGAWKLPTLERTGSPTLPLSLPSLSLFFGAGSGAPRPFGVAAGGPYGPPPPIRNLTGIAPIKPRDMVFTIHRWDAPETRLCLEGIQIMKASDNNRLCWEKLLTYCALNLRFDDNREALIINWCTRVEDQETLDKGHDLGRYYGGAKGNEVVVVSVDDDTRRLVHKEVAEKLKRGKRLIREQEEGEAV